MDTLIPVGAPVAIFGAGRHGSYVYRCLRRFGREVTCFLDNNLDRWGTTYHGLDVRGPAQLPAGSFVIIAAAHAPEIQAQLTNLGHIQDRDFLIWPTWL
jgi:hypothetical protein